jgi:nucleoside-diphosphate-sugar epimerase
MKKNSQKKVLLTGSNGFFGKIITSCFASTELLTLDLKGGDCNIDISKNVPDLRQYNISKVIHCAGKAHTIPRTEREKQVFFDVNTQGTANLLKGLNKTYLQQFIFVSTVAVYGLVKGKNISEEHPLNPNTPYGKSKLDAEQLVINWCEKHQVSYLILRLPLLAGHNVLGNLGEMKKAITEGRYPKIYPNEARKSIVLAKDVALLMRDWKKGTGIYHITDGIHPSLGAIERAIEIRVKRKIRLHFPLLAVILLAKFGDIIEKVTKKRFPISSLKLEKLTSTLTFDDTKARKELGWNPNPVLPFIEKEL